MDEKKPDRTILLVDDETDLRADIADELREAGYAVVEAGDGEEALSILERVRPSLILCDITMPAMDGRDLLRAVRGRFPSLAAVPFIFLTALADTRDVVLGKRAGADDYLTKPIDFDLLLATVASRLAQVDRMRRMAESELEAVAEGAKLEAFRCVTDVMHHVDFGIFLLSRDQRVLFANARGQETVAAADGLTLGPTRQLHAATAADTRALRQAAAAQLEDPRDVTLLVAKPSGERPLIVLVRRLPGQAVDGGPVIVVFVTDPDQRASIPVEVSARMYGLTPAETRIAKAIIAGQRVNEIADSFGIARTTVIFHLRSIFRKTNTSRQAELISLFMA